MKVDLALAGLMLCIVLLQVEIGLLLWLDNSNLKLWNAQAEMNDGMIKVISQCNEPRN